MKLKLIILGSCLLIFISLSSCNQFKSDYKCSELDSYYDSISKNFKINDLKKLNSIEIKEDYFEVVPIKKPSLLNKNFHEDLLDSIANSRKIDLKDSRGMDKLWNEVLKLKVGPITRYDVLKHGSLKNNQAIIYADYKFNDCYEEGYWIALSKDNGKKWKKYFTGITINKNYFFKNNSKISLWKNSHILQIEAVKVKKISNRILPSKMEEFQTIRDSIAILLDLSKITLDSDHDGLTNIMEERMLLNPYNHDTDRDGIIDSKDKNPRFKTIKTGKSILYEVLMGNYIFENENMFQIDFENLPQKKYPYSGNPNGISIFVTDDNAVKGLELKDETLIVMSSREYQKYKLKYPHSFKNKDYSKMFLCDNEEDIFKIVTTHCNGDTTYLVKKNNKGWSVSILEMVII
jgi:hypothetical protein